MTIEELNLSVRAYNALKRAGIDTVEQITEESPLRLSQCKRIGKIIFAEISQKVNAAGYSWSKADCKTCVNSRAVKSGCIAHYFCCLRQEKTVDCFTNGKYYEKRK